MFAGGFYSFRLVFFAFHGKERFESHADHGHVHHDDHGHGGVPHESPLVVTVPLVLLAIPSIGAGWLIGTVVFGDYFGGSIFMAAEHVGMEKLAEEFHGVLPMITHSFTTLPFALALAWPMPAQTAAW